MTMASAVELRNISWHRSRIMPANNEPLAADASATDPELVAKIGSGDDRALETIYHRHRQAVRAVSKRVLRDDTMADDITQEVFATLWQSPGKYDAARGTLRTFLLMMAHARSIDLIRSEEARAARQVRHRFQQEVPSVEEAALTSEVQRHVRAALDELPEAERRAIVLAYFGGLSYRQVASTLGIPEGTIKSRIRTAMQRLHESLVSQEPR